jgi:hypothetical protein
MDRAHLGAHLQMAQRLFDGVIASGLRDLEDDEDFENAAAKRRINRLLPNISDASSEEQGDRPQPLSPSAKRLLQQGLSSLERSVTRVLRVGWAAEHVPYLTAAVDALTAALLRFAQHLPQWDEGLAATCVAALWKTWNRVWSIDGYLLGASRGLYVRAIADPELGPAIGAAYADHERLARVTAMLAMTAAISRPVGTSALIIPTRIVQGLALVTGGIPLGEPDVKDRVDRYCAAFAINVEELDIDAVRRALVVPPFDQTPEGNLLRAWLPVIRMEESRLINGLDSIYAIDSLVNEVPRQILARYRQVVAAGRALGSIISIPSGIACNRCQNALPIEWKSKIIRVEFTPVCESCGILLAPIAWEDPSVAATISRLEEGSLREPSLGLEGSPREPSLV